ncbi:MAG: cob(I)yrinic acid a,c-diamide adenosyltransferase [Bacteroidota bacterium]|nr:cob(I)yrinic acid a,c-diamide adenosyltransferase [Bacteroidota bacterium]
MKIYTKGGDRGKTSLLSGERVEKDNINIEAYGTVDELNSFVGLLISTIEQNNLKQFLLRQQTILFDIGALMSLQSEVNFDLPILKTEDTKELENAMDKMSESLPVLKQFILPGGSPAAAHAHVCRSICRRAERLAVQLTDINPQVVPYLNRLSDYFFVLARYLNAESDHSENYYLKTE